MKKTGLLNRILESYLCHAREPLRKTLGYKNLRMAEELIGSKIETVKKYPKTTILSLLPTITGSIISLKNRHELKEIKNRNIIERIFNSDL